MSVLGSDWYLPRPLNRSAQDDHGQKRGMQGGHTKEDKFSVVGVESGVNIYQTTTPSPIHYHLDHSAIRKVEAPVPVPAHVSP